MNKQMKRWLEGAIFIGFTGTPLLRKDKQMTRDVFGTYVHTYKFHQAVTDKVVLDLKYEARDVPQRLGSRKAIDQWFEQKTKSLNNFQKSILRKRWATMEADERRRAQGAHRRRHHPGLCPEAPPQQRPGHGYSGGGQHLRRLPLLPHLPNQDLRPVLRPRHLLRAQSPTPFPASRPTATSVTSSIPTPSMCWPRARPPSSTRTRSSAASRMSRPT